MLRINGLWFISNQITSCLVNASAEVVWLPLPRFDSSAAFCKLLDEKKGGSFEVNTAVESRIEQRYLCPNILESRFFTKDGNAVIVDFLPFGETALIRKFKTDVPLTFRLSPKFNYAGEAPTVETVRDGIIFKRQSKQEGFELRVFSDSVKKIGKDVIEVDRGEGYLYFLYSEDVSKGAFSDKGIVFAYPEEAFSRAKLEWEQILSSGKEKGPSVYNLSEKLQEAYTRSLSTIIGLFYLPSGAPVAAPTTSLPETIGGPRNWDYRFIWVRDSCIMAEALIKAGFTQFGTDIIGFLLRVMDMSSKPFDQPLYALDGLSPKPEVEIGWLDGFNGSKPVRVGNAAYRQIQLDIEGFFMHALYTYVNETKDIDFLRRNFKYVEYVADWVSKNWTMKDAGIWEESMQQDFTFSKVMMWVTLSTAGRMAEVIGKEDRWKGDRYRLKDWIFKNGVKDGHFVKSASDAEMDAALLVLPLLDFVDEKDPLFSATLKIIENELVKQSYIFRYKKDTIGEAMHPFSLCSTWLSRVYTKLGMVREAEKTMSALYDVCGKSLLLGEHVDIENKDFLGNFPQGFVHGSAVIAMIELSDAIKKQGR